MEAVSIFALCLLRPLRCARCVGCELYI